MSSIDDFLTRPATDTYQRDDLSDPPLNNVEVVARMMSEVALEPAPPVQWDTLYSRDRRFYLKLAERLNTAGLLRQDLAWDTVPDGMQWRIVAHCPDDPDNGPRGVTVGAWNMRQALQLAADRTHQFTKIGDHDG